MKTDAIERVHRALEEVAAGRMVVLVDDEERENEGDLVMAADLVTPAAVNFMARHARGLICLALDPHKVDQLRLPMMVEENQTKRGTAFTVSIEARHGVTTGISAADRAHTVQVAVAAEARPEDLISPGHVFPLRAVQGGVLQRAGHTEGSVDIARLAGRSPAGVICEIMNDDGTMARMPELSAFAERHGLRVLSIADLINYRLQTERLVHKVCEGSVVLPPRRLTWQTHVYQTVGEHGSNQMLALTLGDLSNVADVPVLVRVQVGSVLGDVFGARFGSRVVAAEALWRIENEGRGVILYIPPYTDLVSDVRYHLGEITPRLEADAVLREIGLGSQVLRDLGVRKMRLLTNQPRRLAAVEGYELEVVEQVPVRPAGQPPAADNDAGARER
jgi:3,4-dihydroxy 2-butanone 4-phosphate synthase / GTP cyclohydrolase II